MAKLTWLYLFLCLLPVIAVEQDANANKTRHIRVGIVLDLGTLVGKMGRTSISMARDDFYALHADYTTRLDLYARDSKIDALHAASQVLDLIRNEEVQAIIGPQKSGQAVFISDVGSAARVPVISFSATSPTLSSIDFPYFVRTTLNDSAQVKAISSVVKAFGWRQVVPIYEDTDYGRDIIPYFVDAFNAIDTQIPYRSVISKSATDDQIREELYKLITMPTRVFIVHMTGPMGIRLFLKAKEEGMMSQGYVWITTDDVTNVVDSMDSAVIDAMQGTLGVKAYIPKSKQLDSFNMRWKTKLLQENPSIQPVEPSNFATRAYDTFWALAMAVEKVGYMNSSFQRAAAASNISSVDLEDVGVSLNGPKLIKAIVESKFRGLSGDFLLIDGQLQSSTFQIINVVGRGARNIGFWTKEQGISKQLNLTSTKTYSTLRKNLRTTIWPGDPTEAPKGWEIPATGHMLRIGVPISDYPSFVNVQWDPVTNATSVTGYTIDVFEAVVKQLPYALTYDYIPFTNVPGQSTGYDALVYQVYLQKFDAVVGDVAIRANRSRYVDFTLPYTESGVSMLVPERGHNNVWIFIEPLTRDLWLASFTFFIFTGFVVWAIEHRTNPAFQSDNVLEHIGVTYYFAFSTLVYAHKENLTSSLSKLVVIVWIFTVFILTTCYTAFLTSMITVQNLYPTVTDLQELLKNGDYVGYGSGSFVEGLLDELHFEKSKVRPYDPDDFAEVLSKGSKNGGCSAIVDEIPYIKELLSKNCKGYKMVGPIYKAEGFGFVFPKGSPLVPDVSEAILKVTEGDVIKQIEQKWFGDRDTCLNEDNPISSSKVSFLRLWVLFLITGAVSVISLLLYIRMFIKEEREDLDMIGKGKPLWMRLKIWAVYFCKKKETSDEQTEQV